MPGNGWPSGFARGPKNRLAVLVLASLQGLTPRRLLQLARDRGSAAACLAAVRGGRAGTDADRSYAGSIEPKSVEAALLACGARMAAPGDAEYPADLGDLADPPVAIFLRGREIEPGLTRVAIVGARNCTPWGREVARELGAGLAAAGAEVVSGAARGIDAASHEGALAAEGRTIAVLGCGIDRVYPPSSTRLVEAIAASGTVVSEYPPGVPAQAFRFPARNRIVAALARAAVVVEGAAGSGSLITADHALDLGRPVFAVPGPVTSPLSEVPLSLLRDGAGLIRGADDLLLDLGLPARPLPAAERREMAAAEDQVLAALAGPTLPEQVARALGWDLGQAVATLVDLEIKGLVRSMGGRYEATAAASLRYRFSASGERRARPRA